MPFKVFFVTVSELTDRHGDTIEKYRYDAFGNIFTGITSPYNSVGFTGQEYDSKTGLMNMNARWYNPNVGRFTTPDTYFGTMDNPLSQNLYAYVMNNPVNMVDPTGNIPSWVGDSWHLDRSYINETDFKDKVWILDYYEKSYGSIRLTKEVETRDYIEKYYSRKKYEDWYYEYWVVTYGEDGTDINGPSLKHYSRTKTINSKIKITSVELNGKNQEIIEEYGLPPTVTESEETIKMDYLFTGTPSEKKQTKAKILESSLISILAPREDGTLPSDDMGEVEKSQFKELTSNVISYAEGIDYQDIYELNNDILVQGGYPKGVLLMIQDSDVDWDYYNEQEEKLNKKENLLNIVIPIEYQTNVVKEVLDFLIVDDIKTLLDGETTFGDALIVAGIIPVGKLLKLAKLGKGLNKIDEAVDVINKNDKLIIEGTSELVLKGTNYSAEYAQKLQNTYKVFKGKGYDIGEHGLNRIFGRINQGKIKSVDQVFDVLETGTKYSDTVNGGSVLLKNGVSIHIAEDGFIKSVIGNAKVKDTWELLK